jgi:polysaccharide biosynthesis/export protein
VQGLTLALILRLRAAVRRGVALFLQRIEYLPGYGLATRESRTAAAMCATVTLTLQACSGTARPPSQPPALTNASYDTRSAAAGALSSMPMATNPTVATLNSWILSQVSPPSSGDDAPLGPGDLIEVSVFLVSELSQLKVRIPANGKIALPLAGIVPATGRTAHELEEDLKSRLRERYMHDPQVSVFVQEHKSQQIAVFGSVRNGGVYPLLSRLRLTDALAMAGSLSEDADHVVYLVRRVPSQTVDPSQSTGEPSAAAETGDRRGSLEEAMVAIDLEVAATEKKELNIPLQAGDVIHVPRAGSYYVGGEVTRPGSYLLKAKTSVHQAVFVAGGVKPAADWDDVRVYRPKADGQAEILHFSLDELEKGKESPEIKKNDVIVVGKSEIKAIWFGLLEFVRFGFGGALF